MILFRNSDMENEFIRLDPRLARIVRVMEYLSASLFGDALVVTSIYRQDGTTHSNPSPYRFIDISLPINGGTPGAERIRKAINMLFPYGKDGFQTIPELRHGTAPHYHVQVRPG